MGRDEYVERKKNVKKVYLGVAKSRTHQITNVLTPWWST